MILKVGYKVTYALRGEPSVRTAHITGIELCGENSKYGRPVRQCDTRKHRGNIVCELDDEHWCYADQIMSAVKGFRKKVRKPKEESNESK